MLILILLFLKSIIKREQNLVKEDNITFYYHSNLTQLTIYINYFEKLYFYLLIYKIVKRVERCTNELLFLLLKKRKNTRVASAGESGGNSRPLRKKGK